MGLKCEQLLATVSAASRTRREVSSAFAKFSDHQDADVMGWV